MRTSKNEVKNQHYVPQGLLKNFLYCEKGLCQYIKPRFPVAVGEIIVNQVPRKCCVIEDDYFYDCEFCVLEPFVHKYIPKKYWEDVNRNRQPVDEMLTRMEIKIFPMIQKLHQRNELIYERAYQQKLFLFLHTLAYRNISVRQELYRKYITDLKAVPELYKHCHGDKLLEIVAREEHIRVLMDNELLFNDATTFFSEYDIFLALNHTKEKFILSDDPAFDFRLKAGEVCVPLYPDMAIMLKRKPPSNSTVTTNIGIVSLNSVEVIKFNLWQLKNGTSVFGEQHKLSSYKQLFEGRFQKL